MPGVLDLLQAYLRPVADRWQSPGSDAGQVARLQDEMGRGTEWQAPPGQAMNLSGGDRVFQPGGTIGTRLGLNEAGIYGRDVPMGNQDRVLPPALPQAPAPRRSPGIDPNALPLILRRVLADNPQLAGPLNQMMPRGGWL